VSFHHAVRRFPARSRGRPRLGLLAPGSRPDNNPSGEHVTVLVIVAVVVLVLVALHFTAGTALAMAGGIGLVSARVAACLPSRDSPEDR
jgi:hypothetical protein